MEEKEKDGEKLDHDMLGLEALELRKSVSNLKIISFILHFPSDFHDVDLVQVGALGGPHGGGSQAEDEGGGDEGVELGIELSGHVGRVAEDADNQGPLDLEPLDEDAGHEHAREDQAHVHRGGGPGAQVLDRVDGALQLAHRLEGSEQQQEREGDEEDIFIDRPLLCFPLLCSHVLVDARLSEQGMINELGFLVNFVKEVTVMNCKMKMKGLVYILWMKFRL